MSKIEKSGKTPQVQTHTLLGREGALEIVSAMHLGAGSSFKEGKPRWFEVDIFFEPATSEYIVCTRGMSDIPGETTRARILRTDSAMAVAEKLIVTRDGKRYLTTAARAAIAQGAMYDDDLFDVYAVFAQTQAQVV